MDVPLPLSGIAIAELVIVGFCLLIIFLQSLSESALVRVSQTKVRALAEAGDPRARTMQRLKADGGQFLSVLIIVNDTCIIGASAAAADFSRRFWPANEWAHWVAALGTVLFILVFCEIAPKTYGVHRAPEVALRVARPVAAVTAVLGPLVRVVMAIANGLIRLVGGHAVGHRPFITEEGIRVLVGIGEEDGEVEPEERAMMEGIMELHTTTAREVMVPRTDVVAVPHTASLDDVLTIGAAQGYSRIPVYREGLDDILGVLYLNDLMAYLREGIREVDLTQIARPAVNVPETKKIDELFEEMRASKLHMAIVIDEYGGTDGIVTIEDILEEIVGEITDEHDQAEELLTRAPDGTFIVDARMPIEELGEELDVEIPEGDYDTVGGFFYDLAGHVPDEGETIQWANLTLTVLEADAQRISKLKVGVEPLEEREP